MGIACGLDHWASLFKATTWEELKMLAKNDERLAANATRFAKQDEQLTAKDEEIATLKARLAQLDK